MSRPKKAAAAQYWLAGLHADGQEWFRAARAKIEQSRGKPSPIDRAELKRGAYYASRLAFALEANLPAETIAKWEGLVSGIERALRVSAWASKPTDGEARRKVGPAASRESKSMEDNPFAQAARRWEESRRQ